MNDLKCLFLSILLTSLSIYSASAMDSTVWMPGLVGAWKDSETIPRPGLSLKAVATEMNSGYVMWTAIEVRAFQNLRDGTSQIDLSWPGLFGMLYPGVSLEFDDGDVTPWFYGEIDLFYFPFLLATLMVVDRPWFVPSVYMGPRFGPAGTGWNTGIRVSVPLPPGGVFGE